MGGNHAGVVLGIPADGGDGVILIRYSPRHSIHTYVVSLCNGSRRWTYPSIGGGTQESSLYEARSAGFVKYAPPPSAELKALIEANAPWYVVLDKLSEEYPQWQEYFDLARDLQFRELQS